MLYMHCVLCIFMLMSVSIMRMYFVLQIRIYSFVLRTATKYCSHSAWLYVCRLTYFKNHMFKLITTCSSVSKFSIPVTLGGGFVLFWWHCNVLFFVYFQFLYIKSCFPIIEAWSEISCIVLICKYHFLLWSNKILICQMLVYLSLCLYPVSYTHLTLPTNREV